MISYNRIKSSSLLWFILLYFMFNANAHEKFNNIDSLYRLMSTAQHDTDRIRLAYHIGLKTNRGISYWDSLSKASQRYPSSLYMYKVFQELGKRYHDTAENEAVFVYKTALGLAESQHLKAEALPFIQYLCTIYSTTYNRQENLRWAYKGLQYAEQLGNVEMITWFYSHIALYYLTSNDLQKALLIYRRSLKTYSDLNDPVGIAGSLLDIGNVYYNQKDFKRCARYYLAAKKYLPAIGENMYGFQVLEAVAAGYMHIGQIDSAIYYGRKAYSMAQRMPSKKAMASALSNLAGIEALAGNQENYVQYLLKALELSISEHFTAQLPIVYEGLVEAYEQKHNYKEALKYHKLQVALADSLSGENQRRQALEKEFEYRFDKKESEYRLLAQNHQIQSLQNKTNQYLLIGLSSLFVTILVIVWLVRRQSQLKNEHQRLLLERRLLLSQMNPHFLFNSMNAIHQLMSEHENEQARTYMTEFAKLTRGVLENSTKESITISEEKEMLEAYLRMESLRFENNLSYEINIAPGLDLQRTRIPHLMVQPFVENAIWHGLLPKKGDKKISIEFVQTSEKNIRCIIDDNGIGREEARKKQNQYKKTSLAMNFVTQRILLIGKTLRKDGGVLLIDKKDAEGNATGTKVELTLPII